MYFAVITEIAFPVSEGMLSLHAFCPDCLVVLVMHCFDFMNCASGYYDDCFDYKVICGEERPVVVMSKKHPLANHSSLDFRELKEETFISIGNDVSSAHQYLLEMCKLADFEPKIIMAADYSFRVKLVEDNLGVTLTTDFAYPRNYNLPNNLICAIPILDPILTRTQAIAWRKGRTISNAGQKLMNFLFDYFR